MQISGSLWTCSGPISCHLDSSLFVALLDQWKRSPESAAVKIIEFLRSNYPTHRDPTPAKMTPHSRDLRSKGHVFKSEAINTDTTSLALESARVTHEINDSKQKRVRVDEQPPQSDRKHYRVIYTNSDASKSSPAPITASLSSLPATAVRLDNTTADMRLNAQQTLPMVQQQQLYNQLGGEVSQQTNIAMPDYFCLPTNGCPKLDEHTPPLTKALYLTYRCIGKTATQAYTMLNITPKQWANTRLALMGYMAAYTCRPMCSTGKSAGYRIWFADCDNMNKCCAVNYETGPLGCQCAASQKLMSTCVRKKPNIE